MNRNKLTKRFLLLSAALTMALGQSAFAGETVALNLDDAMLRAFQTNPTVSIAQYELDSARASYNAARQSRGISISANHDSNRSGNNDAPKNITNTHSNTLTAALPIFTGGKLSGSIKQAKANYQYNEVGVQRTYNEMRSTVTDGYFNMLQADNIQKLSAESVTRLEDHLKNVQAQYDVGVVAKVDVLRSQVELANAKQTLIQAENAYQVAEANMNKIVGLPMDTTLKLDNLLVYNAYDKNMDDCLAYAAEHRPELMQAKYGDEAANAFIPLEEVDFSEQDEGLRMILESTHHEEMEKRNFYQQVYFKLNAHLDALDDLNIQLTSTSKDEDLDYYNQIIDSIHEQHEKLMNFINDVFVWRERKDMGAYLGEIPSVEISEEE